MRQLSHIFSKPVTILVSLLVFVAVAVWFLDSNNADQPSIAYYHWANTYKDNPAHNAKYSSAHLYLKLLDIGYRHNALSINKTRLQSEPTITVIAVVFLDNQALKNTPINDLFDLFTQSISSQHYKQLQVDCDWTGSTRDKYFQLLKQLKKYYKETSVTLRLHQIKYADRTGIPPVKRGVLMYYNMSDVADIETKNYVMDNEIGKRYLSNFDNYPLAVDLALPLYQQTRVIRQYKLVQLIGSVAINQQKVKSIAANRYQVTQAHYWQGYYLYQGDELVLDTVNTDDLQQAVSLLSPHLKPKEVIFYRLRDAQRFEPYELEQLLSHF